MVFTTPESGSETFDCVEEIGFRDRGQFVVIANYPPAPNGHVTKCTQTIPTSVAGGGSFSVSEDTLTIFSDWQKPYAIRAEPQLIEALRQDCLAQGLPERLAIGTRVRIAKNEYTVYPQSLYDRNEGCVTEIRAKTFAQGANGETGYFLAYSVRFDDADVGVETLAFLHHEVTAV